MDPIRFDSPGEYLISVQGFVCQGLYDMIRDVSVTVQNDGHGPVSVIHIKVKDQAHLIGILNRLFDSRCVILKVKFAGTAVENSR